MRGRVKGSNEPYQEINEVCFAGEQDVWSINDIEFETDSDDFWNDILVKASLSIINRLNNVKTGWPVEYCAEVAVNQAKALVAELKKEIQI